MKILHFCAGCFYIENMGYQENILPRKHKELGYEVEIFCSRYNFTPDGKKCLKDVGTYINADGIKVTVLPYGKRRYSAAFKQFDGVFDRLTECAPDIIFIHGPTSFSMWDVKRYKKKHPNVKIYADNHADMVNTPIKSFKAKLFYRYVLGHPVRMIASISEVMWGVTPQRVKYMHDVFGVSDSKTDLLVMGGDESKIDFEHRDEIRSQLRAKYGISDDAFLVITGGKIDRRKNIHLLAQAVRRIGDSKIKLAVFGTPCDDMKAEYDSFDDDYVVKIGWLSPDDAYNWFLASDLAVFPGTHSVLWEQAASTGIPMIVRRFEGMEHINVGGNCMFVDGDIEENLVKMISRIKTDHKLYEDMKTAGMKYAVKEFSYKEIAKRAIGIK